MIWPGMGDPRKRKKTLRFLAITAVIAIGVGAASSLLQAQFSLDDPLKVCINDKNTTYKISATVELYIDKMKANIPANVGITPEGCQKAIYTISDNGKVYAEWTEEYPFEIGHFFWMWDFPMRDMLQDESRIIVNGDESPHFIRELLVDGYHYRAEFTSKDYDSSKDSDFMPPQE